jgi:outer membrane protein assembly factor BamB
MMNKRYLLGGTLLIAAVIAVPAAYRGSEPGTGNWPMWGGTPDRNMVSSMKGLPTEWDVKTGKNVKWVAKLGSQSYGNPVVADGMVFVGTNNELLRDPGQAGDRGVLMAFRESDGEFMWQQTHPKLESGRANDWPFQGVRLLRSLSATGSTMSAIAELCSAWILRASAMERMTVR